MDEQNNDKPTGENPEPHTSRDYIDTPVHEEKFSFVLASIPKRFFGLISKTLGVKILLFAVATFLFMQRPDAFPWYAWVIVYIITLFGRDGVKLIREIKK